MQISRRRFINTLSSTAAASAIPATWCNAKELPADSKPKLRFAVASDLHYGQRNTPFDQMAGNMVEWINEENKSKGLDALFINGDLTQDNPEFLLQLRDKHLSNLEVPYHTIKGNHDYVDEKPGSPTESWQKIWGYPSNHSLKIGDFAFVMADTSVPHKSNVYLAADIDWLKKELAKYSDAPGIFMMIHIQQRKHKVDGWPQHGVHAEGEVEKAEAVMDLLESTKNVRAVFHGHNHNETSVYISDERRYFFDSHVGGSWGAKKGYRIVEVHDGNKILSYQVNAEDDKVINRHKIPS